MPSERRYGVLRLLRLAAAAALLLVPATPGAGRLLLDVARAAGAGARQPSTPRTTARTATSARATSPSTSASSATSRSPSGSSERKGVHASPKALGKQCELCHTDHKGRDKDILGFASFGGIDRFDHNALTSFPLEGKHQTTKCNDCHKEKTQSGTLHVLEGADGVRRAATTTRTATCARTCAAASAATTPRRGTCSTRRSSITIATRAIRSRRSTSRSSARPATSRRKSGAAAELEGDGAADQRGRLSEADLPLADVGLRLHAVPRQRARHVAVRAEGVQAVSLGEGRVHQDQLRPQPAHALPARRRARRHAQGDLLLAATRRSRRRKPERRCDACHKDVHQARFSKVSNGNDCAVCHTAVNWPTDLQFDHNARTKFPLTGAHANADCRACHRGKGDADWENVSSLISAARAPSRRWRAWAATSTRTCTRSSTRTSAASSATRWPASSTPSRAPSTSSTGPTRASR